MGKFDRIIPTCLSATEFNELFIARNIEAVDTVALDAETVKNILSREVNVCRNLHIYCKKIQEVLLQQKETFGELKFVNSMIELQNISPIRNSICEVDSSSTIPAENGGSLDRPAHFEELIENSRELPEIAPTVASADVVLVPLSSRAEKSPRDNNFTDRISTNEAADPLNQGDVFPDLNDGDNDSSLACSDDESIMPVYDNLQPTSESMQSGHPGLSPRIQPNNTPPVTSSSKVDTLVPKRKQRLSDMYTNIGMIFPVAYRQFSGGSAGATASASAARALLESMHVQAKVYDEWVEVMSDYSTVFCEDREIRENIDNKR